VDLTQSTEDVCQRYAAMGLRFLASNPEVRVSIVKEHMVAPFLALAESPLLEYQRTAATALASFTLSEENKGPLVRQGGLRQILACCLYEDLQVVRDCTFALANLADSLELQGDIVRGGIEVLTRIGASDDARIQRDASRALASLSVSEELKGNLILQGALPALFKLARSLDIASQRYSTKATR